MTNMKQFFYNSELLDYLVLRPLSHIKGNWDLTYDKEQEEYIEEEDSFAQLLNQLILELENSTPPLSYHENEDCLAEYVKESLNWDIQKIGNLWKGEDYKSILEQGGFNDIDEKNLMLASAGRIQASINFNQLNFDDMETGHQNMLAAVLAIILYHRSLNS